jgi:ADP-ribosylglycohydrolase
VTHRDARAVEGALYVAELGACCARSAAGTPPSGLVAEARRVVEHPELGEALDRAIELGRRGATIGEAAGACGTTGYVVSTVAFATYCFLRHGDDPMRALGEAIGAGGDTDSIGAILGAWLGALNGEAGLPGPLIGRIHGGPFGPTHLRALAACLAGLLDGRAEPVPRYSPTEALIRNLALYPVVLGHGFRRLIPY